MLDGRVASPAAGWRRTRRWLLVVVAATLLWPGLAGPASAAPAGQLQLAAAVSSLSPETPSTLVTISNGGDAPVTDVVVSVEGPTWARARLAASGRPSSPSLRLGTLRPGATVLIRLRVTPPVGGRAGTIVLRATGTGAVRLVTLATVTLAAPTAVVAVELTGSKEIGDRSPGLVTIVLRNDSPVTLPVDLGASGDGIVVSDPGAKVERRAPAPPWHRTVTLAPQQASTVDIAVATTTPVRPRHVTLVLTTRYQTGAATPTQVVTTGDLDLSITANGLVPTVAGIGSTLVLPGLGALLAFLWIREWDRSRLKVPRRSVSTTVWENKLWLLLALAVSLVVISVLDRLVGVDLIATPWTVWLLLATAAATAVGAGISALTVLVHRRLTPLITNESDVAAVLQAAAKRGLRERPVYPSTTDRRGVFVHRDYDLVVVSPPIWFAEPGDLIDDGTTLATIAAAARTAAFRGGFDVTTDWVRLPTPVPAGTEWNGEWAEFPRYEDRQP